MSRSAVPRNPINPMDSHKMEEFGAFVGRELSVVVGGAVAPIARTDTFAWPVTQISCAGWAGWTAAGTA
jgi:hypothetical protein